MTERRSGLDRRVEPRETRDRRAIEAHAVAIATRLDAAMRARRVSIRVLAARSGIHRNTILRILHAHTANMGTLVTLGDSLGVDLLAQ